MIVPQTVDANTIMTAIIALGTLKAALIFGWHSGIAFVATRVQNWGGGSQRFGRAFELATASLIMVLGINILI